MPHIPIVNAEELYLEIGRHSSTSAVKLHQISHLPTNPLAVSVAPFRAPFVRSLVRSVDICPAVDSLNQRQLLPIKVLWTNRSKHTISRRRSRSPPESHPSSVGVPNRRFEQHRYRFHRCCKSPQSERRTKTRGPSQRW